MSVPPQFPVLAQVEFLLESQCEQSVITWPRCLAWTGWNMFFRFVDSKFPCNSCLFNLYIALRHYALKFVRVKCTGKGWYQISWQQDVWVEVWREYEGIHFHQMGIPICFAGIMTSSPFEMVCLIRLKNLVALVAGEFRAVSVEQWICLQLTSSSDFGAVCVRFHVPWFSKSQFVRWMIWTCQRPASTRRSRGFLQMEMQMDRCMGGASTFWVLSH